MRQSLSSCSNITCLPHVVLNYSFLFLLFWFGLAVFFLCWIVSQYISHLRKISVLLCSNGMVRDFVSFAFCVQLKNEFSYSVSPQGSSIPLISDELWSKNPFVHPTVEALSNWDQFLQKTKTPCSIENKSGCGTNQKHKARSFPHCLWVVSTVPQAVTALAEFLHSSKSINFPWNVTHVC